MSKLYAKDKKALNALDEDHDFDVDADQIVLGDEGESPVVMPWAEELASEPL